VNAKLLICSWFFCIELDAETSGRASKSRNATVGHSLFGTAASVGTAGSVFMVDLCSFPKDFMNF
jgi:hypothetical protein